MGIGIPNDEYCKHDLQKEKWSLKNLIEMRQVTLKLFFNILFQIYSFYSHYFNHQKQRNDFDQSQNSFKNSPCM